MLSGLPAYPGEGGVVRVVEKVLIVTAHGIAWVLDRAASWSLERKGK